MYELALFAGAGGGILGGKILGWRTVCAVEIEKYPCGVLMQRQNDGSLPAFPVWDDITTFRADNPECGGFIADLRRIADKLVISGGFPCQDISVAGKGKGISGERSGLWGEMWRLVCEIRPALVYVENSPMLTSRGINRVLGQLSEVGYNAIWGVLGADDVGANHGRKRIWIMANTMRSRHIHGQPEEQPAETGKPAQCNTGSESTDVSYANNTECEESRKGKKSPRRNESANPCTDVSNPCCIRRKTGRYNYEKHDRNVFNPSSQHNAKENVPNSDSKRGQIPPTGQQSAGQQPGGNSKERSGSSGDWWATEPRLGRVANGVANGVARIEAIGNGQVPACMAAAFSLLNHIRKHITQCSENTK